MNEQDLIDRQEDQLEQELIEMVYEWAIYHAWVEEEEISSAIAITNSIFDDTCIDDVSVERNAEGHFDFSLNGTLSGEPRKDDVPFAGDKIHFSAEGVIAYDEMHEDWLIADAPVVSAGVENWRGDEDLFDYNLEDAQGRPTTFLIPQRTPTSVDDLIAVVSRLPSRHWYRGHGDNAWELKPGVARQKNPSTALEETLRLRFENETTFLDPTSHPLGVAKCNFLMQHHGLPTRLLDWSSSPLTAFYFAVCDPDRDGKDACLWVMDPSQLNRQHQTKYPFECGDVQDVFVENTERVLAIHAPYTSLRMKMQQSEFTLHTHYDAIEAVRGAELYLKEKLIIRKNFKQELRERLRTLGISRASLFPDLDNISQTIKEDVLEES